MSDALPSPASQMMFGKAPFHLPLRIIASYAAATPAVKLPELPICVCAQGTLYGVHRYELLATYMQPVGPTRIVLSPDALLVIRYNSFSTIASPPIPAINETTSGRVGLS